MNSKHDLCLVTNNNRKLIKLLSAYTQCRIAGNKTSYSAQKPYALMNLQYSIDVFCLVNNVFQALILCVKDIV